MSESQAKTHNCIPECFYRYQTNNMCTFGERNIPHPETGKPCLYQMAMQDRYSKVDYKEIAAHKWNLSQEPPAEVQRLLKIVGDVLNLP